METYPSLAVALSDLKQRGYEADFTAETASDCLYHWELDMRLDPQEFHVDECHRFNCRSDDSNAVLYAISVPIAGVKGILIDTTGIWACLLTSEL